MNIHSNPSQTAQATRLRLRDAGFSPIPVNGKIPNFKGWQKLSGATAEVITSWNTSYPDHTNTGALTARMPTCDIDILDADAADACEQLIRDRFGDTGCILVRVGKAPKRAIPFQTAKPYDKIAANLIAPNGDTKQKIELLCNGQQVVVEGIHPDTRRPYVWSGGVPGDVKLVDLPHLNEAEARTLVRDLVELLTVEHGYNLAPARPKAAANGNGHDNAADGGADDWAYLAGNVLSGTELHDSIVRFAAKLISGGMTRGAAINIICGLMRRSTAPRDERYYHRLRDIPRIVSSAADKFARPGGSSATGDGKAVVRLVAGELHQSASDAEAGLVAANVPLYIHGGTIVRPIVDDAPGFHGTKTKVARLRPVSVTDLRRILAEYVRFERFDKRSKKHVVMDPPCDLVETILARDGEWRFPKLRGIITTPTLRREGSILSENGYDTESGLLLACQPEMPAMPEKPTRENALEALDALLGVLAEFPFVSDADKSVALSILITPVVRGGMMVAPLHVTSAPTRGTGKSYLFDIAAAIATGERCPVINAGRTEEETEKRLAAELISGQSIVLVDNLNGDFSGDFLCSAIERPVVKPRILGRSENKRIENHSTFFANGNNLRLVGDVVRRAVTCSLDANMERPELRQFKNNPVAAILTDRGRYVAACLTIVRAYLAAGCPEPCPVLASFDDWSRLVRSALVWLGCTDPCDTMEKSMMDDPTVATRRAIVAAWEATIGLDKPMKTAELITAATTAADSEMALSKALSAVACPPARTEIDAKKLGVWLNRNRDSIVDGLKIQGTLDKHTKQQVWWIGSIETRF